MPGFPETRSLPIQGQVAFWKDFTQNQDFGLGFRSKFSGPPLKAEVPIVSLVFRKMLLLGPREKRSQSTVIVSPKGQAPLYPTCAASGDLVCA